MILLALLALFLGMLLPWSMAAGITLCAITFVLAYPWLRE